MEMCTSICHHDEIFYSTVGGAAACCSPAAATSVVVMMGAIPQAEDVVGGACRLTDSCLEPEEEEKNILRGVK